MDAQLLAEIAASPGDDAPRLVYADLLAEREDPRGELIYLQIKQKRDGYIRDVEVRIDELMRANAARWTREAGIRGCLTTFSRGFPFSLIGSAADVIACREALRTQPITSLSIMSRLVRFDEVMALHELARVTELSIGGEMGSYGRIEPLTDAQVRALATSPYLTRLRELHIHESSLDQAGARILATAPWLRQIEKLVLGKNPIGSDGFAAIARELHALRHLALPDVDLRGAGAAALAAAPTRQLEFAYLANATLGDEAVAFARSPILATVHHLDLEGTHFGNAATIALASSPHARNLVDVRLSRCLIKADGARALADSAMLAKVARLDLRGNYLGHDGLAALAAGTGLPSLQRLGITDNALGTGVWESDNNDEYPQTYEVQLTAEQIAARFAHRAGIKIE